MSNKLICILDYGSGNVRSVQNVIKHLGYNCVVSNSKDNILNCSHLILPGVGSFSASMRKIENTIPFDCLENQVLKNGKPFLGICVGMQVLGDVGYEFEERNGFGWIPGSVEKLMVAEATLPHIGWNDIVLKKDVPLFRNLKEFRDFYFVHSYHLTVKDHDHVLAYTEYEKPFSSIVSKDNIFGFQFHPEKSQKAGQLLLNNFIQFS
jgi:glutamine amidotransferase